MDLRKFDIDTFFQQEANEIFGAREKGIAIHKTKNIDAAGDEIELPVRDIIKNHLPLQYYVGQGHLVDSSLQTSGQFDIMIADNKGSPILFTSENKTDFLTYESVYAVGEVKSTYYRSKKYVQDFITKIQKCNDQLQREQTPPDQFSQDIRFKSDGIIQFNFDDSRPYKNPLFKFMFFVNSGDVDFSQLGSILNNSRNIDIPNLIVFLDKGIILKAEMELPDFSQVTKEMTEKEFPDMEKIKAITQIKLKVELWPEFIAAEKSHLYRSAFYEFDTAKTPASTLAYTVYALNTHIRSCMVLKPDLIKYHSNLFSVQQARWI